MAEQAEKQTKRAEAQETPEVTAVTCLARAFYASPDDLAARIPELRPLRDKKIALVGLGCLGAPSALEFARAGLGQLGLVDHDVVDPAASVRWPFGFRAAGQKKVHVIKDVVEHDYPYTRVKAFDLRVGGIRDANRRPGQELLARLMDGADLVYDCTAEVGVQHFLTDYAWECGITYIGVAGTRGGWGGKVFRIRPTADSACFFCYRLACEQDEGISEPPAAPAATGQIQPTGCADHTFTGAGFDMLQVALMGVRMAVSTLCEEADHAYPAVTWDAVHIGFRNQAGELIPPTYETYRIKPQPSCWRCGGKSV